MNEAMWLLVERKEKQVLIGVVYLQPECSAYSNNQFFTMLTSEICNLMQRYPMASIILGGDINARIEVELDYVDIENDVLIPRQSMDECVNVYGKKFLSMVKDNGLVILNGRVKSDRVGE